MYGQLNTKNVAIVSTAALLFFLALIAALSFSAQQDRLTDRLDHKRDGELFSTCLTVGRAPSECRLAVFGG